MKTVSRWLIIDYDGRVRLLSGRPNLRFDEVAYLLTIRVPAPQVPKTGHIDLTLPPLCQPEAFDADVSNPLLGAAAETGVADHDGGRDD